MKLIPKFLTPSGPIQKATPEQIKSNKRKQLFLNLHGYNVKVDGSWGSWQDTQYKKAMRQYLLDWGKNFAEQRTKDYLTTSNDVTSTNRTQNTHLQERAVRGAKSHAAWEKEHPNLTAWGNTLAAVPFAVAATPAVVGLGDAAATTAVGQAATKGLSFLSNTVKASPIVQNVFPWLNAGATSAFAAHGLSDVTNGKFTPETALELAPLGLVVGKGTKYVGKGIDWVKKFRENRTFKSELDWSPESWFSTRQGYGYDADDIAALKKHVPEYHKIERQTKANGTWLKMPDGSTWTGDPRSWVLLLSKNGAKLALERLFGATSWANHSHTSTYPTYDGETWLLNTKKFAEMWTGEDPFWGNFVKNKGKIFEISYPKDTKILPIDAKGADYNHVPNPFSSKKISWTDKLAKDASDNGFDIVKINNVTENFGLKVDDTIVLPNIPRKSILGNNGNFNLKDKNIYRMLIPTVLGSTYVGSLNENK